eukprot:372740_1
MTPIIHNQKPQIFEIYQIYEQKNQKKIQSNKFTTEVILNSEKKGSSISDNELQKIPKFEFGESFYKFYGSDNKPSYDNLKYELLNNKIFQLPLHIYHSELIKARNHAMSKQGK